MVCSAVNYFVGSSWVASSKQLVQEAGRRALDLFKTYVANPLEKYTIGDLRTVDYENLDMEWTEGGRLGIHRFGLLGSTALWKPNTPQELAEGLHVLDEQTHSRAAYRSAQTLLNSSPFLLADTSSSWSAHRKAAQKFLKPHQYAEKAWEFGETYGWNSFKDLTMRTFAHTMLGVTIPLTAQQLTALQDLHRDLKTYAEIPCPAVLLQISPSFREKQKRYQDVVESILAGEIKKLEDTKEEPPTGLIAQEILRKMAENPQVANLHKDPELKSLVLWLLGVGNLNETMDVLEQFLADDGENGKRAYFSLLGEIRTSGVLLDGGTDIDASILMDKRQMPALHELYVKCLNEFSNHPIAIRYVHKETECAGLRIPSRTYLAIMSPTQIVTQEFSQIGAETVYEAPTSVFSEGSRKCPGRVAGEAVFKAIVVGYLSSRI